MDWPNNQGVCLAIPQAVHTHGKLNFGIIPVYDLHRKHKEVSMSQNVYIIRCMYNGEL